MQAGKQPLRRCIVLTSLGTLQSLMPRLTRTFRETSHTVRAGPHDHRIPDKAASSPVATDNYWLTKARNVEQIRFVRSAAPLLLWDACVCVCVCVSVCVCVNHLFAKVCFLFMYSCTCRGAAAFKQTLPNKAMLGGGCTV